MSSLLVLGVAVVLIRMTVTVVLIRMTVEADLIQMAIRSSCLPPRCAELHRIATQLVANQRRAPSRSGGVEIIALVP